MAQELAATMSLLLHILPAHSTLARQAVPEGKCPSSQESAWKSYPHVSHFLWEGKKGQRDRRGEGEGKGICSRRLLSSLLLLHFVSFTPLGNPAEHISCVIFSPFTMKNPSKPEEQEVHVTCPRSQSLCDLNLQHLGGQ